VPGLEHLDRPDIPDSEKRLGYADLETVSRLPFQLGPLARAVERIGRSAAAQTGADERDAEPLRLVELGAGTGRIGLRIAERLARAGRRVELLSTDISPAMLPAPRDGPVVVRAARLDAVSDPLPAADVIFANLLIHHLSDPDAASLLRKMRESARLGGAVFDLDRNPFAFHFLRLFFPLWARSPLSPADALISVQQAFRVEELRALADGAGIERPRLRRYLGLRTLLWWESVPTRGAKRPR
jgi:SAM-dependent methyltransferase